MKQRDICLDIAKGISTLWIVGFWHLTGYYSSVVSENNICQAITVSVLFCFMYISGSLMHKYSFSETPQFVQFYKKRFFRFWILLFLSCISLYIAGIFVGNSWFVDEKQLIYTIIGLSSLFPPIPGTVWFMSMLMLFYILTPIIRRKNNKRTIIIAVLVYFLFIILEFFGHHIDGGLFVYYPAFVLGLVFPVTSVHTLLEKKWLLGYLLLIWLTFILLLPEGCLGLKTIKQILFSIVGTSLVLLLSKLIRINNKSRLLSAIEIFSYLSLCLYLFHRQIFQGVIFISKTMFHYEVDLVLMYCVMLPLAILCSYFIQRGYDYILERIC